MCRWTLIGDMAICKLLFSNKILFVANVIFLFYQLHQYNIWLSKQTKAIESIKLPDCPKVKEPEIVEKIIYREPKWSKWNFNWDGREPRPGRRSTATRYIYLVRHGQYYGSGPLKSHLSSLGKAQAKVVGSYLKNLNFTWHRMVCSTAERAKETMDVIHDNFFPEHSVEKSDLLKEGWPTFPEPPFPDWDKNNPMFATDGARLAKAFETYIHRAEPGQTHDTNELFVAHGNVISYFILRALQLPPERWLKIAVLQGSITLFMIGPDSHVTLKYLGDVGFMPKHQWSG